MTPQPEQIYRTAADIAEAQGNGRRVVMALGQYDAVPIALEGSALSIWEAVDGTRSVAEILESLAVQFGMHTNDIAGDVFGTMAQFAAHGLIQRIDVT